MRLFALILAVQTGLAFAFGMGLHALMSGISGWPLKDAFIGKLALYFLSYVGLGEAGKCEEFKIDTGSRRITFKLRLKGEEDRSLDGIVTYHVESATGQLFLVADEIRVSREWINLLIKRHLPEGKKRVVIPPRYHALVRIAGI